MPIAVWLVRGAAEKTKYERKPNTWIKPCLFECLNEVSDGAHIEKSLCACATSYSISVENIRGPESGGRLGGRTWGSLSCHLRTASLVTDSYSDLLPRSICPSYCLFIRPSHKGVLVVIKAPLVWKWHLVFRRCLFWALPLSWAPSLLPRGLPHWLCHI